MRRLGQERSRTLIIRIPGEWFREFERLADGGSIGGAIREVLHGYLKRAGKVD